MDKLAWINRKILSREALQYQVNSWKASGQKVVFTNGVFDLMHRGHFTYLAEAASLGNRLVVGLNTDASVKRLKGESRPIQNEADRALQLASLLVVDAVCLFDEDTPLTLIQQVQPDVLAKGGDYTIAQIVGADEVQARGGEVVVIPFIDGYSTTALLSKIIQA